MNPRTSTPTPMPVPSAATIAAERLRATVQDVRRVRGAEREHDGAAGERDRDRTHHARDLAALAQVAQPFDELFPEHAETHRTVLARDLRHA